MEIQHDVAIEYFKKIILICDLIVEHKKDRGLRYPSGVIMFSIFFGGMCAKV